MEINRIYKTNYLKSLNWILSSSRKRGGSSAYFLPFKGWSKAYPETTGYIIPTLLEASNIIGDIKYKKLATEYGLWLLSIQDKKGFWNQGLYPFKNNSKPSIFNTGQILLGLLKLYEETDNLQWINGAEKALNWLANGLKDDELWGSGDYLNKTETPSYYSHVIWPMLEVCKKTNNNKITKLCKKGILNIILRKQSNGVFKGWGFEKCKPAFTHNIGYTIKGIQESGRILNDDFIRTSADSTIEKLIRISELRGGKLPGLFDDSFKAIGNFVCLTGNLQIAENLLTYESYNKDLRIVNSAAKLIDFVCSRQSLYSPFKGIEGGIAGSSPLYGKYMRFRYPNWASKYLCDVILKLSKRVEEID